MPFYLFMTRLSMFDLLYVCFMLFEFYAYFLRSFISEKKKLYVLIVVIWGFHSQPVIPKGSILLLILSDSAFMLLELFFSLQVSEAKDKNEPLSFDSFKKNALNTLPLGPVCPGRWNHPERLSAEGQVQRGSWEEKLVRL